LSFAFAGQHDDRQRRGRRTHGQQRSQTLRVGQAKIDDRQVEGLLPDHVDGLGKALRSQKFDWLKARAAQQCFENTSINPIIFKQQNLHSSLPSWPTVRRQHTCIWIGEYGYTESRQAEGARR